MSFFVLVKPHKFIFYIILGFLIRDNTLYAHNFEPNQCVKLLEAKKQKPNFKDLVNTRVRALQSAQDESFAVQKAAEEKRIEEDNRQREEVREALLDPDLTQAHKIHFIEIKPGKFKMGEGAIIVDVEITRPFGIMDTWMTQMIFAHLSMSMGYQTADIVFPSRSANGPNSIWYRPNNGMYIGTQVKIRPNDPVTRVGCDDSFIQKLNEISKSSDTNMQKKLKRLIPDHQKNDEYDFVTEAQFEYVMKLARTIDNNEESNIDSLQEVSLLPLYIDGKKIYFHRSISEWMKDVSDTRSPLPGGKDPVGTSGLYRIYRRGSSYSGSSAQRGYLSAWAAAEDISFRLVRVSRGGQPANLGGTP